MMKDVRFTSCHVDLGRGYAYGETVLGRNYYGREDENGVVVSLPPNCHYAASADPELFYDWLYGILKNAVFALSLPDIYAPLLFLPEFSFVSLP